MTDREGLPSLMARVEALLLDFDGPVCKMFAGLPATEIADQLRAMLPDRGADAPDGMGPHELLTFASLKYSRAVVHQIEESLRRLEIEAAATSSPTSGSVDVLTAARHLPVGIASNNAADAIRRYLRRVGMDAFVDHVEGRDPEDIDHMKPSPYLLKKSADALGISAESCVFIGDAVTDILASTAAGMPSIGYANIPDKFGRLTDAGAAVVVDDMHSVAQALDDARRTESS